MGACVHCAQRCVHACRWSIVEDCCLKYNRTIGHGEDAFFWTDAYQAVTFTLYLTLTFTLTLT